MVSTMMWRLRPPVFLPASYPLVEAGTVSAPFTLWASGHPALGASLRPAFLRTSIRSSSWSASSEPSSRQRANHQ